MTNEENTLNGLPIVKILNTTDEASVKLELDMDDAAYERIVEIGRDGATDDDFFSLGFTKLMEEYLEENE